MKKLLLSLTLLWPVLTPAQDAAQIARLDQEVRQLQREVQSLTQLVMQLRARSEGAASAAAPPAVQLPPVSVPRGAQAPGEQKWISAAAWRSLRVGMSELDVIGALGPPVTARGVGTERLFLYALELGPGSFLAGSVTLRDHAVVGIETPVLR